jgi:integrase/recombinase XerD
VERMQSLGCRYDTKARDLRRFDRFLQTRADLAGAPLSVLLKAWGHAVRGVRHQLRVQQCGRTLTQALHRRDATTAIMSIDVGLQRRVLQEERKPYLFTDGEIQKIFAAARTYPSPRVPLRPIALHTMVTLAYCVGLRIGEIVSLTLGDVDLVDGLLEIRDSKFFKSRRLPLAPSVLTVLSRYLHERAGAGAPICAAAPLWWTPARRQTYSYRMAETLLTRVIRRAGLKPARGNYGPRVHDLRHTFVAHRMLQWYRDGVDPQTRLPHLATYLGHKDIQSTLVYLNITPELLQQASERYRRHGVDALGAAGGRP